MFIFIVNFVEVVFEFNFDGIKVKIVKGLVLVCFVVMLNLVVIVMMIVYFGGIIFLFLLWEKYIFF